MAKHDQKLLSSIFNLQNPLFTFELRFHVKWIEVQAADVSLDPCVKKMANAAVKLNRYGVKATEDTGHLEVRTYDFVIRYTSQLKRLF